MGAITLICATNLDMALTNNAQIALWNMQEREERCN